MWSSPLATRTQACPRRIMQGNFNSWQDAWKIRWRLIGKWAQITFEQVPWAQQDHPCHGSARNCARGCNLQNIWPVWSKPPPWSCRLRTQWASWQAQQLPSSQAKLLPLTAAEALCVQDRTWLWSPFMKRRKSLHMWKIILVFYSFLKRRIMADYILSISLLAK